ncbi:DUF1015 domain-containing protein [Anaerotignum sp. MSJ-24]|uniref:DUF1015 domain-containing protein n=1 Tax=Anaerotignum sp. MSJ-24 TaxID=2841521 RepID=UPI001C10BA41|nr:DUF1015 family protein [Anaerotignum sp. MSJ-24]MBU5464148.1 DUF1015 family protein [Anaerotignum sp. MSJ-24]
MAVIRKFKAIRPTSEMAEAVAALPYDVVNSEEAREMTKDKPYSFLHVDKAEIDLPVDTDIYSPQVYAKAKENLDKLVSDGILVQDNKPMLYVYELTMDGRSQTGLVACTSIDEYLNGIIKKHELTREDKEQDRIHHVDICNANTGPIFLAYRTVDEISAIIENVKKNAPVYDFTAEDGIKHRAWVIDNDETANKLIELFKAVPNLYIADGHHRNASAAKVGLKRRAEHPDYTGNEEFNYYLAVIFPSDQLKIMDYNRVVKDLNGMTSEEFMNKLAEKFDIHEAEGKAKPEKQYDFGMYLDKKWYMLTAKENLRVNDAVAGLDVSILQDNVLIPILGIGDIRTDKRIDFVGGIRGLGELERRVDSGEMKVAFAMYPTSIDQLMTIADENKIMPPKSTWFEPKLRSGLFIHSLD